MRDPHRTRTSRAAIQRMYIAMRHLFIRGSYKPMGVSGEAMKTALIELSPEIYGSVHDPEKVELSGLLYIFERLPRGIEECRFVRLVSREGLENANFPAIVPAKRRRNCYRIDEQQMFIEMTRGRSDIYDVLTHLTFMYIESEKIRRNSMDNHDRLRREWLQLEEIVNHSTENEEFNEDVGLAYLSILLGRTYNETSIAGKLFDQSVHVNSLFDVVYGLGKLAIREYLHDEDREITFSGLLRERIGHHIYGEAWANNIKQHLWQEGLQHRPLHIISSNLHSVVNVLYGKAALGDDYTGDNLQALAEELSTKKAWNQRILSYASQHGLMDIVDESGTNLQVQVIDILKMPLSQLPTDLQIEDDQIRAQQPVILVMDYAFGEQAYETMDELLKPYTWTDDEGNVREEDINVHSISIMGKAGILSGKKGDLMIPTAYVFEGTADNYPLQNDLSTNDFSDPEVSTYQGPMITVLGTSLQNKQVLQFFKDSSWGAVGLEMEGAHYQKAIQAASQIRHSIRPDVCLRYAYYASDNPLITGHTLASGSLGKEGVRPTYLITIKILQKIFNACL